MRINKYKSEWVIKLVGFHIRQKWQMTVVSIVTKMGNINRGKYRMNDLNVNHLVGLYDGGCVCTIYPIRGIGHAQGDKYRGGHYYHIHRNCAYGSIIWKHLLQSTRMRQPSQILSEEAKVTTDEMGVTMEIQVVSIN